MKDRRKKLKEEYSLSKPDMGIFKITNLKNDKVYLCSSKNVKAFLNRTKFQLESGMHPNIDVQKEFNKTGKKSYSFEILEILEYEEDETKTDYSDDLELLLLTCLDNVPNSKRLLLN